MQKLFANDDDKNNLCLRMRTDSIELGITEVLVIFYLYCWDFDFVAACILIFHNLPPSHSFCTLPPNHFDLYLMIRKVWDTSTRIHWDPHVHTQADTTRPYCIT
jgi:hypothetical protein